MYVCDCPCSSVWLLWNRLLTHSDANPPETAPHQARVVWIRHFGRHKGDRTRSLIHQGLLPTGNSLRCHCKTQGCPQRLSGRVQERLVCLFHPPVVRTDVRSIPAPHDNDARLKMQECEKIVRRIDFLKAIELGDPPSAAEGLDLNAMG